MNPIIRNILVLILAIFIGMSVNMGLIMLGSSIIPMPEGVDPMNANHLKEFFKTASLKYYLFPFLAHAVGTLVGAFLVAMFAASHKFKLAMGIGFFFILGGAANIAMISPPIWYSFLDIVGAYFPMAWLGAKIAGVSNTSS